MSQTFISPSVPDVAMYLVEERTIAISHYLNIYTKEPFIDMATGKNPPKCYHHIEAMIGLYMVVTLALKDTVMQIEKALIHSAANKGWSAVNYRQSLAFDRPYLSCNDLCDR